jgi:hypothetical protein
MTETQTQTLRDEIAQALMPPPLRHCPRDGSISDAMKARYFADADAIMPIITRIEAERDAARATLAAARTMLAATGAALADATKRIAALEEYMQNNPNKDTGLTKEDYEAIYGWGGQD